MSDIHLGVNRVFTGSRITQILCWVLVEGINEQNNKV